MTAPIRDLSVETVKVSALRPYANNPRTHSKRQIEQIAESIHTFGWTNPILVDGEYGVIAGHGRLEAAKTLGLDDVPVMRLADMSEAQKRAYVIADNRLAETAGWDEDLLRLEIGALLEMELDFQIEAIGFETGEIDVLLQDDDEDAPAETVPEPDPGPPVSRVGDIWQLGRHRLVCGDALDADTYTALLGEETADAVFTDPPYNVPISGHVCGLGSVHHDEFVMASGEMSAAEFRSFLDTMFARLQSASRPGAIAFVCMDWRHIADLIQSGEAGLGPMKNLCVWDKQAAGMGSLYRSQHELVAVFRHGNAPHRNNVQLGRQGRHRSNVWAYPGVHARRADLKLHPTVKPTAMVADAIRDVTAHGDLVLDPFGGSGATLLAAEETGRRAALAELDPRYVDLIVRRFQEATGEKAVLTNTGETIEDAHWRRAIEEDPE